MECEGVDVLVEDMLEFQFFLGLHELLKFEDEGSFPEIESELLPRMMHSDSSVIVFQFDIIDCLIC